MAAERPSRRILVAVVSAGLAVGVGGCRSSDEAPARPAERAVAVSSATGAFTLTTLPGDARAGLRFAGFVAEGTVVIENEGQRARSFALRQEIDGGELSGGARKAGADIGLRIVDTTGEGAGRELYRGPVAGLSSVSVGKIAAGDSREYAFKLTPRAPLRESGLDLSYSWVPGGVSALPADQPRPPEQPAPRLGVRLRIPPEQGVIASRKILVFARCTVRCELEAQAVLRAPSGQSMKVPVTADRLSSPQRPARLELRAPRRLFAAIRAALTRGPPVTVILRVKASGDGGGSAMSTERIRLKPRPDRRRRSP